MFYSEVWEKAQGAKVWIKGKEYIDFTSGGIFCANLGNNNPAVRKAIADVPFMSSYRYDTKIRQEYREKLLDVTGYEDVAFFSDGSMAVEAALRVMDLRYTWGDTKKLSGTFHGKTKGPQGLEEVRISEGWVQIGGGNNYIVEGYRGEDAHFWSPEIISELRESQKAGSLICFDEIQSCFGRTGKMFAYEHYDIKPDLLIIGKAAGNGFPLSAVLTRYKEFFNGVDLSCTHGGNPMAMAAGLATIEIFEKFNYMYHLCVDEYMLQKQLRRMREKLACKVGGICPKVNGRGMVAALICKDELEADEIYIRAFKKGLLLVHTGKNTVKIGPPLTISWPDLNKGLRILEEVLHDIQN
ncbi:MAG: aminotransferase class III-fold pyridoxal phosphate-dependent enzyme [Desulfobacteraceae bacterium]|nr:MAG: aminotransferase class III-fold pyridoxal phosphate-dependent enzyme [Desulfobacteraceae bacterium]